MLGGGKEEINFRGTLWLYPLAYFLLTLSRDSTCRSKSFFFSTRMPQVNTTAIWTPFGLMHCRVILLIQFIWMAIKAILDCLSSQNLRNWLSKLVPGYVFLIWNSLYCCSSLKRHVAGKTFPVPVLMSKLDMVMSGCRSAD